MDVRGTLRQRFFQKALQQLSDGAVAGGGDVGSGEVMQQMGLRNIVPASMGAFPQLNPEYVVRAQPQVILLGEPMAVQLYKRPGWSNMAAVKWQRVCAFKPSEGDVLVRPGPRLGEAAQLMLTCLQHHFKP